MNPKMTIRLTNYVLILVIYLSQIRCNDELGIPVFIWSTHESYQSNPLDWKSRSTVSQINANVLRDDYLNKSQTIVAFVQKELNIEQFTTEDTNRLKTLSHIMTDRTVEPVFLSDVLNPSEAFKDFSTQDLNSLDVNNGDKVIIELPNNNLVENDELIGQIMARISENVTNAAFLLTGRYRNPNEVLINHRFKRQALEKRAKKPLKPNDDMKRLVNKDDCLYFYTRSVAVHSKSINNASVLIASFDSLRYKPSLGDTECWKDNGKEPALLDLTYQKTDAKLVFKLRIGSSKNGYWEVREGTVTFIDKNAQPITQELDVRDISAEKQFSYSCSKLTIRSKVEDKQTRLTFDGFQLQPFRNPSNKKGGKGVQYIFADSFDCEPWMTLGLWMGLITLWWFTLIIFIGVYALSRISAPERFENPKAKPLIITNVEE